MNPCLAQPGGCWTHPALLPLLHHTVQAFDGQLTARQRRPRYVSNIWLKRLKQLGLSEHLLVRVSVPTGALGKMDLLESKFLEESERRSDLF